MTPTLTHISAPSRGRVAALVLTMLALVAAGLAGTATQANASAALGCAFNASGPYLSGGSISTRLSVKCNHDTWLYWHARLTKDRNLITDVTAGSSDGLFQFPGGQTIVWYLNNNRV